MSKRTCASCFYLTQPRAGYEDQGIGTCSRFPPVLDAGRLVAKIFAGDYDYTDATEDPLTWLQPVVYQRDTCGEYRPRKQEKKNHGKRR